MPFDLKSWLNEVFDDDTEVKTAIENSVTAKAERSTRLQSAAMRTADYKKSKDELATKQRELDEFDTRLNADYAKLGESRAEIDKEYRRALRERDELATRVNSMIDKVKTLADENGIDATTLGLEHVDTTKKPEVKEEKKPAVDTSEFISKKDFQSVAGALYLTPAELMDLDDMHRSLFDGKPLANKVGFQKEYTNAVQSALKAGRGEPSLTQFFEEKFKVAERKEELRLSANEAEIERRVQEKLIAERSKTVENKGVDPNQEGASLILRKREDLGKVDVEKSRADRGGRGVARAIATYDDIANRMSRGVPVT